MLNVLAVCLPFFLLVACGYAAGRGRWVPLDALPGLNRWVLFFALPALLFQLGRRLAVQGGTGGVATVYALCAAGLVALTWWLARRAGRDRRDAGFAALVTSFPNTGFMGVPLISSLLGPDAAAPVAATIVIDLCLTSTLCLALAGSGSWRQAMRGSLTNPLPWAVAAGWLWGWASGGAPLPGVLESSVNLLGQAASPTALFALGLMLWRVHQEEGAIVGALPLRLAALKLVLHPVWVGAVAWAWASAVGGPSPLTVLVLVAALPCAANVALLAEVRGADTHLVSRAILLSTALAPLTLPLWAWGLGLGA
ncbi:AEC family transporter [Inhella sp. 4Y17]|uniref:AEC family transporter n=2 Tax=Inhella gelatinilytica TaxID=2795030 RepID=A0A931NCD5_9BURK|nr:AEC family transporter [Inhella gelatinilytica]